MCQTIFYFPGRVFALMHLQVRDARRLHISQSSSVRSEGRGAVNQGAIFLQSLSGRYEDSVRLERKKRKKTIRVSVHKVFPALASPLKSVSATLTA